MSRFAFTIAGEAHGPGLVGILTGLPRNLSVNLPELQELLSRRRTLAGRGPRSSFEDAQVVWIAGVDASGMTTGGPVAFLLPNKDASGTHSSHGAAVPIQFPRPGHADASGSARWGLSDATPVAELASGRLTAAYCVMGHVCMALLAQTGIATLSHVTQLGRIKCRRRAWLGNGNLKVHAARIAATSCLTLAQRDSDAMEQAIAQAAEAGDSLGGQIEVVASPMPAGLGVVQPLPHRLDARIAELVMGIPGIKAVEIGNLVGFSQLPGSKYHDAFAQDGSRKSNNAGGLEGGMTNGLPLVVRAWVKPLPTLRNPLESVSLVDGCAGSAAVVRSDVSAVGPTALAAEALVRVALVEALLADGLFPPTLGEDAGPRHRRKP